MAKLIYPINVSLDGYMEDERGNIEWSISDDEVFAFWTDFQRPIGTYLYGRRMYESMVYWETASVKKAINRRKYVNSRRSGELLRRSCIHRRFSRLQAPGLKSSANSILMRFGGFKSLQMPSLRLAAPSLLGRR